MKIVYPTIVFCLVLSAWAGPALAQQTSSQTEQRRDATSRLLDGLFRVRPGLTLTEQQQTELKALRDKLGADAAQKLLNVQQQRQQVYTREQNRARRNAQRAAREAGKTGEQLREAVDAAVNLSAEQKQKIAQLQQQQQQLLNPIRQQINAIVGQRQANRNRAQAQQRQRQQRIRPTEANVSYGPHERNVLDFWQAKSSQPTPVLVSIHGGGFRGGNKSVNAALLKQCLDAGISVVAITYRLSDQAIAPAQFYDSARAVQFVRSRAKQWNLDPNRLAATGGSAGAGISLWLGFHDDLADPDNSDPVLRQSTRLSGMFVTNGQTSYDPRFIRELFPGKDTYQHPALAQLFDVDLGELDNMPEEKYDLMELVSPLNHLTKDDAPAILSYNRALDTEVTSQGIGIHHPKFGVLLKKKMDELGIRCEVIAAEERVGGGTPTSTIDFVKQVFEMDNQ